MRGLRHPVFSLVTHYLLVIALVGFGAPLLLAMWLLGAALCLALILVVAILPRQADAVVWQRLCRWEEEK